MGYKGTPHVSLDIFNYQREKVCNLYDSAIRAKGQAYEIILTTEATGWKEIEFRLPFQVDKEYNHRWDSVKSEYLLRVSLGNKFDWFIVQSPNKSKDSKAITNKVYCAHISSLLKTKNLYLVLDDTNGIGTIRELGSRILAGTGWSLGEVDTLYESDGKTEKVRSLLSDGKSGAHKLLTDLCSLFDAYPEFDGETKVVNLRSMNNKGPLREMMIGRDINSLSVKPDSSDLITRLYIEGEYGDDGYVGIDDVNPTGLTYILNFDYYKEIGLFTDVHQKAYDTYVERMSSTVKSIRNKSKEIAEKENQLNTLWGQPGYALYPVTSGLKLGNPIVSFAAEQKDIDLKSGDDAYVLGVDTYRKVNVGDAGQVTLASGDQYVLKLFVPAAGFFGAKEAALDTKEQLISNLTKDLNNTSSEEKKADIQDQINKLVSEKTDLVNGDGGISDMLSECITIVTNLDSVYTSRAMLLTDQQNIEVDFVLVVGDMLKDGYWQNKNYAIGQEKFLFDDGIEVLKSLSRPKVTYTFSRVSLAGQLGYEYTHYDINTQVRVYDKDLGINDIVHVSKTIRYLDDPQKDTVEVTNEDLAMTAQTLDSILSRMADIANLVEQRSSLYDRARAISKDGSIFIDRLSGQINILKNRLSSAVSSWYTDDRGNIIFENTNGRSAMMLTGDGFMIANGKTEDGEWNWRTFGTGEGFTADMIVTGFLSAERIETGSIGSGKLSKEVQDELAKIKGIDSWVEEAKIELTPEKITQTVLKSAEFKNSITHTYFQEEEPQGEFNVGDRWIQPTVPRLLWDDLDGTIWEEMKGLSWVAIVTKTNPITYIWDGTTWVSVADFSFVADMMTTVDQTAESITHLATKETVNALTGQVTSMETRVTQTAEAVKQMATKGDLTSAIEQTASSLSSQITNVETGLQTKITQNERSIGAKVDKNGIIAAINLSAEEALIQAPKIKFEGLVTANNYFMVKEDGSVEAKNAVISGNITALSGSIGGWQIDEDSIYSGSGANTVKLSTASAYAIWAGAESASSAPFRVTKTGELTATDADIAGKITSSSGSIGGWTIKEGYLHSGTGSNGVYLSTTDTTYRVWAGADLPDKAPFKVSKSGALVATNAKITGEVTADSGTIGGWSIGENLLYSGSGNNRVALSTGDSTYAIWAGAETPNNASFRVTKDGKVYLTRVMALANEGDTTPTEVDLSNINFWRLNRAVRTLEVNNNVLTIGLYNGTTVNFKKAATGALYGSGSGADNFTVSYIEDYAGPGTGNTVDSGIVKLALNSNVYNAASRVVASFDGTPYGQLSVGGVYTAGRTDGANTLNMTPDPSVTPTINLGYGEARTVTATTETSKKAVTLVAPADRYNSGKTDGANSLSLYAGGYEGVAELGYGGSVSVTATTTKGDGTSVSKGILVKAPANNYNNGWNECIDHCSATVQLHRITQASPGTLYMLQGNNYVSVGSSWVQVAAVYNTYFIPERK